MSNNHDSIVMGEGYVDQITNAKSENELKEIFAKAGLDYNVEVNKIKAEVAEKGEELSDEQLEGVSGGWATWIVKNLGGLAVNGVICLATNMRRDGSFVKCTCGLHHKLVRR